jgi:tetratricopeptide (TPR) repeat protein
LLALFLGACGSAPPNDPFYLGEAKRNLASGHHWFQVGCYKEAGRFFDESLVSARLSDSVLYIVMSLNARGAAYLAQRDMGAAASVLNEALELTLAEPGQPELPALLSNMGTLAYQAGRMDDARDFWKKAAEVATSRGQSPGVYLANLARLELEQGRQAEFEAALAQASATLDNPGTPKAARSDILNLSATLALGRGETDRAEGLINEAMAIDRALENQVGLAQDLETLHDIYLKKENYPAAAQSLSRAFYLRASLNDQDMLKKDLALLRSLNKSEGHPGDMSPFEAIAKKPSLFDPLKEYCP